MARRDFSVSRLPGFATVAILVFSALYLPIVMLVVYSFNAGTRSRSGKASRCDGIPRPGTTSR